MGRRSSHPGAALCLVCLSAVSGGFTQGLGLILALGGAMCVAIVLSKISSALQLQLLHETETGWPVQTMLHAVSYPPLNFAFSASQAGTAAGFPLSL